ncbi:hypothetical protein [Vibrio parahaemolyticus]|uniref:hypothetical protein n=1 Tax=Vibrio parahaemolyticus TaxID=670 RepID=UPI00226B69E5|nr:hypothetical protein [Vibrio parahaemolyticus]MCX8856246.1 hypothetical protein [Vibrio parahaemolyticus]MCX8897489.1 hypothetical protein [Vibrio parahaemolyticus]MCX8917921.1 hypothetical protein [Vibrio parahaemolyticus]
MKTLNIAFNGMNYTITIQDDNLKVELNNQVLREKLHAYHLIKSSKNDSVKDAMVSVNANYIFALMHSAAAMIYINEPISFNIESNEFGLMKDFLLSDDNNKDALGTLSDFAVKYNLINEDGNFNLKKINLLFDDMSSSSVYRAVNDNSYKTSSSLLKKIELMDFILDNMSNTKYHQILEL